jgi:hypothetical protein
MLFHESLIEEHIGSELNQSYNGFLSERECRRGPATSEEGGGWDQGGRSTVGLEELSVWTLSQTTAAIISTTRNATVRGFVLSVAIAIRRELCPESLFKLLDIL